MPDDLVVVVIDDTVVCADVVTETVVVMVLVLAKHNLKKNDRNQSTLDLCDNSLGAGRRKLSALTPLH